MSKSPIELLRHIKDEILFIEKNSNGLDELKFIKDDLLQHAFMRSIEIIGEAVKNLPKGFKEAYPNVDWKRIAATRNRLIHEYFDIDLELIWNVINIDIPELKVHIEVIINENKI